MSTLNLDQFTNERARAYFYRVLVAVVPILATYGYVSEQVAALVVSLGAAILGVGVAAYHTPRR